MFPSYKKSILSRPDKSNKGSIDKPIKNLINTINEDPRYCTTSSCSGRIVLHQGEKKNEMKFTLISHTKISPKKIVMQPNLWFRFEPAILHVACDSIESAVELLNTARRIFKHSGILSIGNFPVLEIRGSEFIEAPLHEELISKLCTAANKKLLRTHQQINKLKKEMLNEQPLSQ